MPNVLNFHDFISHTEFLLLEQNKEIMEVHLLFYK